MMPQPSTSRTVLQYFFPISRSLSIQAMPVVKHPARVSVLSTYGSTMRLSFPSGEHADVIVRAGTTSIGSAQGNQVVLSAAGVLPWHAQIVLDSRGMVLEVLGVSARVHVNARPILEKALLRLGDAISVDAVTIVLKPDQDDFVISQLPVRSVARNVPPASHSSVLLRGVSGTHFGKAVMIDQRLSIGRSMHSDLRIDDAELAEQHAAIEISGDCISLHDLDSTQDTAVNGVMVREAVLHPGDQLRIGRHRFVLEAPGFPLRGQHATTPPPVSAQPTTVNATAVTVSDGERSGIWWLLFAAALIGVGIAALLMFGGR